MLSYVYVFIFVGFMITWWMFCKYEKAKKQHNEIDKRFQQSLENSKDFSDKLRTKYEPTYDEIKEFYSKYVIKYNLEWDTVEPLSLEDFLEEYLSKEKMYKCNLFEYLISKTALGVSLDPKTGYRTYFN